MDEAELRSALAPHSDGVLIAVWAVPGASRSGIVGLHAGALRIRVAARPEGGKANRAIAELLTRRLGVAVELHESPKSRRKTFLAAGLTVAEALERLDPG